MKRVLLINWDSYPHVTSGGVATWAKGLVENLPDYEFVIFNQLSNPNTSGHYRVPANVTKVMGVPIFGTTRLDEYVDKGDSLIDRVDRTTDSIVARRFLPVFERFLREVVSDNRRPEQIKRSVLEMRQLFARYDAKKCLENPGAWETYLSVVRSDPLYSQMKLREALINFQLLQRSVQVLSIDLPKVDVIHSSLAWLPSLLGVAAKAETGARLMLTEHGVAFRELLLYYNTFLYTEAARLFWISFTLNVVRTIYDSADLIVPVCKANEVWEKMLGADPAKIRVVYNGVDTRRFKPVQVPARTRPTVVCVSRISVFKDIVLLVQSIDRVRQKIPDVQCLLYGDTTEPEYRARCLAKVKELKLEKTFVFKGVTKEPEKAFAGGDVVAFSSVTEGFPFAVIEAMACGKAIVATDVGGVREALEGCGLLVRSRDSKELADGIMALLTDPSLRSKLETQALDRARSRFDLGGSVQEYRDAYEQLSSGPPIRRVVATEVVAA